MQPARGFGTWCVEDRARSHDGRELVFALAKGSILVFQRGAVLSALLARTLLCRSLIIRVTFRIHGILEGSVARTFFGSTSAPTK